MSNVNRRQLLAASATGAGLALTSSRIDASKFGALGDGVSDDAPSIQAALDHVGGQGGGTVYLPSPPVHYRIASSLKLPSHTALEGVAPVRYPFNRANKGACALVADLADARQWVIEPKTQRGGKAVPFDQMIAGDLPDGITYNCGVRNLLITSQGTIPFGGIRMHGCPGSFVEGVAIDRVGCGLLVNYSFGGSYQVHVDPLYYGVAAWEDANANLFEAYCSHRTPWPDHVPDAYLLPFMRQAAPGLVDVHKLSTPDHATRPFGILCGATGSTSINNVFDVVVEQFPGGIFLLNAYATDFRRCYLEGDKNKMRHAIVAARSRFSMQALHAYLSNSGSLFDLGLQILAKIFGSGILYPATFGKMPPADGSSLVLFEGIEPGDNVGMFGPSVRYAAKPATWHALELARGWRAAGKDYEMPAVRFDPWSHQVELRGTIAGGGPGPCFELPPGKRPARRRRFAVAGGQIEIGPDGRATLAQAQPLVSLDGINFAPW